MRNTGVNLHGFKGASDETYIDIMANLGFKYTFSGVFEHERLENIANLGTWLMKPFMPPSDI